MRNAYELGRDVGRLDSRITEMVDDDAVDRAAWNHIKDAIRGIEALRFDLAVDIAYWQDVAHQREKELRELRKSPAPTDPTPETGDGDDG